jgi:hypothetical protein
MTDPQGATASAPRAGWILGATWLALVLVATIPQWPGVFTIDSQVMYRTGLDGNVSDWYAPVHGLAWGMTGRIGLPIWVITVAGVGLFVGAVMAVLSLRLRPIPTAIATSAVVLWPPVLGLLSWVGRDVWFVSWMLLTISAAFRAHAATRLSAHLAAAGVFGLLAADARQNGAPVVIFVVAVAIVICLRIAERRRTAIALVLFAAATAWISLTAVQSLIVQVDDHPEQFLFLHDLAEHAVRTGTASLPVETFPSQDAAVLERYRGPTLMEDAIDAGVLIPLVHADQPGNREVNRALRSEWLRAIGDSPANYLHNRADLYVRQLGLTGPSDIPFYGRSDEHDPTLSASTQQQWPTLSDAHTRVLLRLSESGLAKVLYAPALYLVAGLGASAVLARIDRQRVLWAFVFALQVALQFGLIVTAPVVRFRYQYFQVVLGLVVVVLAVHVWRTRTQRVGDTDFVDTARIAEPRAEAEAAGQQLRSARCTSPNPSPPARSSDELA